MGQIPLSQAIALFNNYQLANPGSTDANAIWFDIRDITNFVNKCSQDSNVTGIRVYFGKYSPGLQTVFMIATSGQGNAEDEDFTNIDAYNYGQTGYPPRIATFPKTNP